VNCLEFRRQVGAEPFTADPAVAGHRAGCPACARHQDELQAMDRLLGKAMQVGWVPGTPAPRRWVAMAASLVAGVLVAATLWLSWPAPTLASEVIGHVMHEPGAWSAAGELPPAEVAEALDSSGARLRPGSGTVTFAKRCFFDRHWVPHLVVQTESGPVTVLLLGHRDVAAATHIDDQGFSAVVLPAPRGSIAVVGQNVAGLDAVARQILDAVEWDA